MIKYASYNKNITPSEIFLENKYIDYLTNDLPAKNSSLKYSFRTRIFDAMYSNGLGAVIVNNLPKINPKIILKTISKIIGNPTSYDGEGNLIMDIKPNVNIKDNIVAFNSANYFDLHTDMSYIDTPPDYVALYVEKNDLYNKAKCLLCPIDSIVNELSPEIISILKSKIFKFETSDHYKKATGKKYIIKSILSKSEDGFTVRFRSDKTLPLTSDAKNAMEIFRKKMNSRTTVFAAPENTLIIYDNKKVTHGRTSFQPTFNNKDRLIKRIYVNKNHD